MKRYVITGRYGSNDTASIPLANEEELITLNIIAQDGRLNYGMDKALDDLIKIGILPSETGADLLVLAAHVQAADTHISRDTESQDSWTREIRLVVPVQDLSKWNAAAPTITRALNFLTGDLWTIQFRLRPTDFPNIVPDGTQLLTGIPFDKLSLFSGGLDSLIGAIDLLENGHTPLLISHAGDGSVSDSQNACFEGIKNQYPTNSFERLRVWMSFRGVRIAGKGLEKTTRGRSFLFFTIGVLAGTGFSDRFTLLVPENGLIALNIPLDQLRLGSHSTRTTHPFYIARWNEILTILQINGRVENPYCDKTKGEMVSSCANQTLLRHLLPSSMSCSSPTKGRYRRIGVQHCGYCLPCLIRRAALKKGLGADNDPTTYTVSDLEREALNTQRAEGVQIRSFQVAIERLRANPEFKKVLIHSSGSLSDESPSHLPILADMYQRGLLEVEDVIGTVNTGPR